jgi:hypothetical protein
MGDSAVHGVESSVSTTRNIRDHKAIATITIHQPILGHVDSGGVLHVQNCSVSACVCDADVCG